MSGWLIGGLVLIFILGVASIVFALLVVAHAIRRANEHRIQAIESLATDIYEEGTKLIVKLTDKISNNMDNYG